MTVDRFYECRFAPSAATWREAIRVGQLVHDRGVSAYESFAPRAFAGWGASEIPVLIDHDVSQRAGTVTVLTAHRDWHIASFVLDGPYATRAAEFIAKSGKVSPGLHVLDKDLDRSLATPITPAHRPTHWYFRAQLDEISILPPGEIAWYAGAKVTGFREAKPRPTERQPRREVLVRNGNKAREIGRRRTGQDLVVSMSDGSQVIYHGPAGWAEARKDGAAQRPLTKPTT